MLRKYFISILLLVLISSCLSEQTNDNSIIFSRENSDEDYSGNLYVTNTLDDYILLFDGFNNFIKIIEPNYEKFLIDVPNDGNDSKLLRIWKLNDVGNVNDPNITSLYRQWEIVLSNNNSIVDRTEWIITEGDRGLGVGTIEFSYPDSGKNGISNDYSVDVYLNSKTGSKIAALSPGMESKKVGIEYGLHYLYFNYWISNPYSNDVRTDIGWIDKDDFERKYEVVMNSSYPQRDFLIPVYYWSNVGRTGVIVIKNPTNETISIQANDQLIEDWMVSNDPVAGLSYLLAGDERKFYIRQKVYTLSAYKTSSAQRYDYLAEKTIVDNYEFYWVVGSDHSSKTITIKNNSGSDITIHADYYGKEDAYMGYKILNNTSVYCKFPPNTTYLNAWDLFHEKGASTTNFNDQWIITELN